MFTPSTTLTIPSCRKTSIQEHTTFSPVNWISYELYIISGKIIASNRPVIFITLKCYAMKHKRSVTKSPNLERDYGKDLYDTVVFLLVLLGVLWYFNF